MSRRRSWCFAHRRTAQTEQRWDRRLELDAYETEGFILPIRFKAGRPPVSRNRVAPPAAGFAP